jgi:hypothetical protein
VGARYYTDPQSAAPLQHLPQREHVSTCKHTRTSSSFKAAKARRGGVVPGTTSGWYHM